MISPSAKLQLAVADALQRLIDILVDDLTPLSQVQTAKIQDDLGVAVAEFHATRGDE